MITGEDRSGGVAGVEVEKIDGVCDRHRRGEDRETVDNRSKYTNSEDF